MLLEPLSLEKEHTRTVAVMVIAGETAFHEPARLMFFRSVLLP